MKDLVLKVLSMRKAMLLKGVCLINRHHTECAIQIFQRYADFYPNASDQGYIALVKKHYSEFMFLMPGKSHTAYEKLHKELNIHLNT